METKEAKRRLYWPALSQLSAVLRVRTKKKRLGMIYRGKVNEKVRFHKMLKVDFFKK